MAPPPAVRGAVDQSHGPVPAVLVAHAQAQDAERQQAGPEPIRAPVGTGQGGAQAEMKGRGLVPRGDEGAEAGRAPAPTFEGKVVVGEIPSRAEHAAHDPARPRCTSAWPYNSVKG